MMLSIIAAVSENRVIGANGQLPWKLPADLKRFRVLTMGHHLLMGRKTFASIGRPLPGRTTVVITRRRDYAPSQVLVAHGLKEAVEMARADDEVFIAGGAQIYHQALNCADRIYLTVIHQKFEGDAYFPEYDETDWQLISQDHHEMDERNPYLYSFLTLEKRRGSIPHPGD